MEVIFEFKQIGQIVKVTAIDCQTGMEATIRSKAPLANCSILSAAKPWDVQVWPQLS